MSGEELYNYWAAEMESRDVGVDLWSELDEIDKEAWTAIARRVRWV